MTSAHRTKSLTDGRRRALPASIILSPRELKYYRRWQRQTASLNAHELGFLPTATEYEDFQRWFARRDSGYSSDVFDDIRAHIDAHLKQKPRLAVAAFCGHPIHPATKLQITDRCPVCTIKAHLRYMETLTRALGRVGDSMRQRLTHSLVHETVFQAWYCGKLNLIQEIHHMEILAEEEVKHADGHTWPEAKTAGEALKLYWQSLEQSPGDSTRTAKATDAGAKSVRFADDTEFGPGRSQQCFWRRSPRYEAGKHCVVAADDSTEGSSLLYMLTDPDGEVESEDIGDCVSGDENESEWEDVDSEEESEKLEPHADDVDSYIVFEED